MRLGFHIFTFLCAAQKNAARVNCAAKKYEKYMLIVNILLVYSCIQEHTSLYKYKPVCTIENMGKGEDLTDFRNMLGLFFIKRLETACPLMIIICRECGLS